MMDRMSNKVLALLMVAALGGMACLCGGDEPAEKSRWEKSEGSSDKTETRTTREDKAEEPAADEPAEDKAEEPEPVDGSALNKSFPADGADGFARTFTQEKEGFAEAKFVKGGDEIVVTVSDTAANPVARKKFGKASETIQGFPAMKQGNNGTVVLVNDRFQVKATSKTVDDAGRTALLDKANLSALPGN